MCAFDKVNSGFQVQEYNQGSVDSSPTSATGSMPDGKMVQSPSSENILAGKGIESEAHSTMRDSGTQISERTQTPEPTSFKPSQPAKNQGVNRTNEKGKNILGGLSSHRSAPSVGADTAALGSKGSSKNSHITPSKLVSRSQQHKTYLDARAELKPKQQKLEAFISIADRALENPKKQSPTDLGKIINKMDEADKEISDWKSINGSKSSFLAVQDFAKEMGRDVKSGKISREQGADAIKLFLKLTQSSAKDDSVLESKGQRAKAQIGTAFLKYHSKSSSKIGNLPKSERKARAKELIADLEKAANKTDAEIYESATDVRFQNKPELFIEIMDKESRR